MASNAKTALLCAYALASARRYAEAEALILSEPEAAKTAEALDLLAPASLPVQLVRPKGGELIWVMDEAACGGRQ